LSPVAQLKPGIILLSVTTGFVSPEVCQWLMRELHFIQSRLVVAWIDGNPNDVAGSSAGCSAIVLELIGKTHNQNRQKN